MKYRFTHIETADGLANNVINDILQDSKGYMWLATNNGLQRYDGNRFLDYHFDLSNQRSLPSDIVAKLIEDEKGNIWVACNTGVAIINQFRQRPTRVPIETKARDLQMEVTQLFEDSKKNIWLACRPYGLFCYDKSTQKFIEAKTMLPSFNWPIRYIAEEKASGNFWFGCDSGLAYYDVKQKTIYNYNNNPINHPLLKDSKLYGVTITGLYISRGNLLMFNTFWTEYPTTTNIHYENYEYNLNTQALQSYKTPVATNHAYFDDKHGNTWVFADGLFAEKKNKDFLPVYSRKDDPYGIKARSFYCIYEDEQHNYWVGTENGLYIFNREKERINRGMVTDHDRNPVESEITDFMELPDGRIWLSTWGSGIYEFDKNFQQQKQYTFLNEPDKLVLMIWSMLRAKSGTVWIGCQAGRIMTYNPATQTFTKMAPKALDMLTVRTIAEDQQGNIWFGTQHGYIIKFNSAKNKFIRFSSLAKKDLFGNIHQLYVDKQNNLWACTGAMGLLKIEVATGKILERFQYNKNNPASISGIDVNGVISYNDSLMIVASGGLNILNTKNKKFEKITTQDGLPSNTVLSMQRDEAGNIWAGLAGALVKVKWPSKKIEIYGKEDGVLNSSFQLNGMRVLRDGRLVAGTSKDFIYFNPKSLVSNSVPPDVKITGLNVFQNDINIDSVLTMDDKLRLSYEQSFLTIQFSSLTYLDDKYTYYYKLEGLDKDWIRTKNLYASYSHLSGGNYTFYVKCENSEGVSSVNTASLKIYIRPPFWETWWFYFLLAAATAGLLYFIHRQHINRLIDMQKVRSRIARDLHDDMGSTLSTINILSEMAKMKIDRDTLVTKEYLGKISDNSSRMMEAMDDIVWSINPMNDNMQKITARMREYATNLFEAKDIEYTFHVDDAVNQIRLDMEARRDFFLIYKEAINNLVKYSNCKNASVKIEIYEYTLVMKIQDNGVGFDVNSADNGNGLANMQKRAQALNAILNIESKLKAGTKVVLEVKFA